jgi:hypothetical protein
MDNFRIPHTDFLRITRVGVDMAAEENDDACFLSSVACTDETNIAAIQDGRL